MVIILFHFIALCYVITCVGLRALTQDQSGLLLSFVAI